LNQEFVAYLNLGGDILNYSSSLSDFGARRFLKIS